MAVRFENGKLDLVLVFNRLVIFCDVLDGIVEASERVGNCRLDIDQRGGGFGDSEHNLEGSSFNEKRLDLVDIEHENIFENRQQIFERLSVLRHVFS